jgi:hypothetical protein
VKIAAVTGSMGYTHGVAAARSPATRTRLKVKRRLSTCVAKSAASRSLRVNDVADGLGAGLVMALVVESRGRVRSWGG